MKCKLLRHNSCWSAGAAPFGLVTQMVWYMHAEVSGGSATENSPWLLVHYDVVRMSDLLSDSQSSEACFNASQQNTLIQLLLLDPYLDRYMLFNLDR